jgi:hypothetical protein
MRKRRSILVIVLAAGLAVAPAAWSIITPVNFPTPMPVGTVLSGAITNIDPVNQLIQIRDNGGMIQSIRVDDHIEIRRGGSPVSFSNLSLGDSIIVISVSKS